MSGIEIRDTVVASRMNHRIASLILGLVLLLSVPETSISQPWLGKMRESVAFLSAERNGVTYAGTAFFTAHEDSAGFHLPVFLVTAKHVLRDEHGKYFEDIQMRINRVKNDPVEIPIHLTFSGEGKNVYFHPDSTVDLAVMPIFDNKIGWYDITPIPFGIFAMKKLYSDGTINVGDEVFYTGLFIHYRGEHRNIPIMRFGRIALLPTEPIQIDNEKRDLILIETVSIGGHSGSPVFVNKPLPDVIPTQYVPIFVGVLSGSFQESSDIVFVDMIKVPKAQTSSGISGIVPSTLLIELIDSIK